MEQATAAVQTGIVVAGAIDDRNPLQRDTNPYAIRWGFQMAVRDKVLPACDTGIAIAPFGAFFPVKSFNRPEEKHTIDWTQPREEIVLRPADECERSLMEVLAGTGAQGSANWGFVAGFHDESDGGKMAVISSILMPNLSSIRAIQQDLGVSVIDGSCLADDPTMDAEPREQCVTCWWLWLNSPALDAYIEKVGGNTVFTVSEVDGNGSISQRQLSVSVGDLKKGRDLIKTSGRQAIKQLNTEWNTIAREYASSDGSPGSRRDITEYEHNYRRDLHRPRPEDRQFELAKAVAGAVNQQAAGDSPMLKQLAELTISTTQLTQKLANDVEVIKQAVIPAVTVDTTPPAASEAAGAKTTNLAPAALEMEKAKNTKKGEK